MDDHPATRSSPQVLIKHKKQKMCAVDKYDEDAVAEHEETCKVHEIENTKTEDMCLGEWGEGLPKVSTCFARGCARLMMNTRWVYAAGTGARHGQGNISAQQSISSRGRRSHWTRRRSAISIRRGWSYRVFIVLPRSDSIYSFHVGMSVCKITAA